ncbi:MAG TPA: hypothetical protein DCW60_01280 [Sutterella sp.]|nr:hypothetical protein [Sutterella sp.]
MKNIIAKTAAAAALLTLAGSAFAFNIPYLLDNSGKFAHSTYYNCVRTGQWTPAAAKDFKCDADIVNPTFAFDSAELDEPAQMLLASFAANFRSGNVNAVGYADRIGPASYNKKLSLARANSVKDYLVSRGVPAGAIAVDGKGSANPVVKCKNGPDVVECLRPNRRVDVEKK